MMTSAGFSVRYYRGTRLGILMTLTFEHIHLISADPLSAARWYVDKLGAEIIGRSEVRGATQINLNVGGATLLIRGQRLGELPKDTAPMQHYKDYSSHNEWGVDHFGFVFSGDLRLYAEELKKKGVTFLVEPYDFMPGSVISYVSAPDGVSIEIVQAST